MVIDTAILNEAGTEFKEELMLLPAIQLKNQTKGMVLVETGVKSKLVLGSLFTNPEFVPAKATTTFNDAGTKMKARVLQTKVGIATLRENKNTVQRLADRLAKNYKAATFEEHPLAKLIMRDMLLQVGKKINRHLFNGVYDANGTTTITCMDGLDTITATEITATTVSAANTNLYEGDALHEGNIGDVFEDFFASRYDELKEADELVLTLPHAMWFMYNRWRATTFGAAQYNKEYLADKLHCAPNTTLKWHSGKSASNLIHLTTPTNLVFGIDDENSENNIEVRRDNDPQLWQFVYSAAVAAQIESIEKEVFSVFKFTVAPQS